MGGAAGKMENKAISASNLKVKLKLTEAELGNIFSIQNRGMCNFMLLVGITTTYDQLVPWHD